MGVSEITGLKVYDSSNVSAVGTDSNDISITEDGLNLLIKSYCRESGVRNLRKHIEKIFRKAAFSRVKEGTQNIVIDKENLQTYVGKPIFTRDKMYESTPAGVCLGLAWTSHGGSTLYIETIEQKKRAKSNTSSDNNSNGSGSIEYTGNLGDVMKESIRIAYTYSKWFVGNVDSENNFLIDNRVHLHVPEGAIPKDGPSAGCTIVTAIISLATGRPVRENLAMTGEISLRGKVLAVGGIKEKVIAAKRAGVDTVILPADNRKDYDDLPQLVKDDVNVHFADTYQDVYNIAFPTCDKTANESKL